MARRDRIMARTTERDPGARSERGLHKKTDSKAVEAPGRSARGRGPHTGRAASVQTGSELRGDHSRAPNLALVMLPILPAGNHPWQTCPVNPYYLPCRDIPPPRHVW